MSFNQGIPGPATLINSSSTLLYGNSASANALSVQQLGAGNVFVTSNASGRVGLFVSATSNVGVGTTNPQYPLDIGGFASSAQTLRIGATSSNACVRIMEANDTYGFSMENIATAVAGASGARMDIVRHSASAQGTPIMSFIRDNPYVGIGTTSPQNTLQVQTSGNGNGVTISGDNNTRLSFSATNTGISRSCSITLKAADSSDKSMQFWNNSTDITAGTDVAYRFLSNATSQLMSITNAGNVGIGVTNPGYTLTSAGTICGPYSTTPLLACYSQGSGTFTYANVISCAYINSRDSTQIFAPGNGSGGSAGNPIMTLQSGPLVGIGTASPSYTLDCWTGTVQANQVRAPSGNYLTLVNGAGGSQIVLQGTTTAITGGTVYMTGGNVGIGTASPGFPLEVGATVVNNFAASYGFYSGSGLTTGITGNQSVGAKISGYVWSTNGFLATSDARIKIVNPEPVSNCLNAVNQLRVCKYEYIDKITDKSNKLGFIAQEVQKLIPESVTMSESIVPNIFKMAESVQSNVITIANHGLVVGDTVKLVYGSGAVETNVRVVRDTSTFQVEAEIKDESVFVYGKKVNDFLTLDHTQVFTCAIGAIQELSAENTALKTQMASLEQRLAALEARA